MKEGDIINIDVTAIVNGWHGDTSRMFFVGDVSVKSKNLVSATYDAMMKGISIIKNGLSDSENKTTLPLLKLSKCTLKKRLFCC